MIRRKGRPRQPKLEMTPELREKHGQGLTLEPMDLLLKRAMVTQGQHWAANHLRWLYSKRYGISKPRQVVLNDNDKLATHDPEFVADLALELLDAEACLKQHGASREVFQIAVFGERPKWFGEWLLGKQSIESRRFMKGLEVLASIF
jgi:hypothetical protein